MLQIKKEYLNAVAQYLAAQPYKDVMNLIPMLQTATELNKPQPESDDGRKEEE